MGQEISTEMIAQGAKQASFALAASSAQVRNAALEAIADALERDGIRSTYLLGTEGTIDSHIYQDYLAEKGIECLAPSQDEYSSLRECIEAVKQDKYTDEVKKTFLGLVNRYDTCILGCTELPIIYEKYAADVTCKKIYDPLKIALEILKEEYDRA